jgi:hypothetical protein
MLTSADTMFHDLALLASLGCGLNGGFFFAFSVVVMRALAERPVPEGIAVMQCINVVVLNRWFLGVMAARWQRALSCGDDTGDHAFQCAPERGTQARGALERRSCVPVGGLLGHVDRLESCARRGSVPRLGMLRHRNELTARALTAGAPEHHAVLVFC